MCDINVVTTTYNKNLTANNFEMQLLLKMQIGAVKM